MDRYPAGYHGRNMMRGRSNGSCQGRNPHPPIMSHRPDVCIDKELGMDPCGPIEHLPIAMAYVPYQRYSTTFDLEYALKSGTIFPELCKPFCGKGVCRK